MIGSVRAGTRPPDGLARRFRSVRADALAIGPRPSRARTTGPQAGSCRPLPTAAGPAGLRPVVAACPSLRAYPAPLVALRQRLPRPERQRRLRRAVRAGRGACRTGGDGHCTGRRRGHPSGLGLDEGSTPTSSARRSSMSWPSTPRSASPGSTGGSTEGCRVEGSTRRRPGGGGSRSRHRIAAHAARGDSTKGSLAPLLAAAPDEGRDRNPGDATEPPSNFPSPMGTLNEGRDRSPGDTRSPSTRSASPPRSTKAGTGIPATRGNATAA